MGKLNDLDVIKLAESGLNYDEIAEKLHFSKQTVKEHMIRLGFPIRLKICKSNDPKMIDAVSKLVDSGKTNQEIADILKISPPTVRRYTRLVGKDTNSVKHKGLKIVHLTNEQLEIIYGGMLGDMSITLTQKQARLIISQGGSHEEYFDHLCKNFKDILGKISKKPRYDKRTNKYYNKFIVKSLANPIYLNLYNEFYKDKRKTITKEWVDKLTPRSLAYWFMDDGFLHGGLATNCFTPQEIKLLQDMFLNKYDINTRIYHDGKKNQDVLFICFESLENFENLIKPYMIESMYYKLRFTS